MKPIRVAIVGCGRISDLHQLGYRGRDDAVIVAVCDTKKARAKKKARAWGVEKVYTRYQQVLEDPLDQAMGPEKASEPTAIICNQEDASRRSSCGLWIALASIASRSPVTRCAAIKRRFRRSQHRIRRVQRRSEPQRRRNIHISEQQGGKLGKQRLRHYVIRLRTCLRERRCLAGIQTVSLPRGYGMPPGRTVQSE